MRKPITYGYVSPTGEHKMAPESGRKYKPGLELSQAAEQRALTREDWCELDDFLFADIKLLRGD